ncbi:uracil-DNA glycosylase [Thermorudis peleae]|uniref:uracil-DNA glycosylase family protein n=1 Tax=Thermorudis peleae TaxID=1382356 RepID=UPI0009DF2D06|nr:uracil-DNA glycosylase [Thermorudis peleae]
MSEKAESTPEAVLADVAARVKVCTRCELARTRTHAVPGEGNPHAEVMFIGEAPGWNEDKQGRPFVGAAGQFLNELLERIGLRRSDVFITNIVKCRPPGNRDPLPDEIVACAPYLEEQIAAIRPKVIVTLGRYSMARWFPTEKISKIHGQPRRFGDYVVVPMYHPAAALHQPALKAAVEQDMMKLPQILEEVRKAQQQEESAPAPPQQMRLF